MSRSKTEGKGKDRRGRETCDCPFCLSGRMWEEARDHYTDFFSHMRKARIEILRGFRSLIDRKISNLEQEKRKVTKVKVE
jgi:hypothetical protein